MLDFINIPISMTTNLEFEVFWLIESFDTQRTYMLLKQAVISEVKMKVAQLYLSD